MSNQTTFLVIIFLALVITLIVVTSKIKKKKSSAQAIVFADKIWECNPYKDEFGRSTGESYIVNNEEFGGSFSNTATNNDKLTLYTYFDKNHVSFRLWRYGNHIEKNAYGQDKEFEVLFLTDSGEKYSTIGIQPAYKSDIYLPSDISNTVTNILRKSRRIQFIIKNNATIYKFYIRNGNFSELYDELYSSGAKLWINGEYKGRIDVSGQVSKEEMQKRLLAHNEFAPLLNGKNIKKIIYFPNGYNIVLSGK
ncbi:MAG: hypothetical protein IJF44_04295 [Clostridia bacterium]|nr:hypothetical protein [Clostridia bacterium]